MANRDPKQYEVELQRRKDMEQRYKELSAARQEEEQKKQTELQQKRAELKAKGLASCPKCASTSIATINRGYSIVTGFIGSGKAVNVCQCCGHRWPIGK